MYLCLFTLYHVSAFMFTKIIKKGHYHDCDNGLVFLWTGLFAQPLNLFNGLGPRFAVVFNQNQAWVELN